MLKDLLSDGIQDTLPYKNVATTLGILKKCDWIEERIPGEYKSLLDQFQSAIWSHVSNIENESSSLNVQLENHTNIVTAKNY